MVYDLYCSVACRAGPATTAPAVDFLLAVKEMMRRFFGKEGVSWSRAAVCPSLVNAQSTTLQQVVATESLWSENYEHAMLF